MKLMLLTHRHRYGTTPSLFLVDEPVSAERATELLISGFESEREYTELFDLGSLSIVTAGKLDYDVELTPGLLQRLLDTGNRKDDGTKSLGLSLCERGNTLLVDPEGSMAAWLDLDDTGARLEVAWNPNNYPSLHVRKVHLTDAELAAHINTSLYGWYPRKCNVEGVVMDGDVVAYTKEAQ